ncbi:MAG: hypothetical protein LQ349_007868, partial [Xanthoria aureola]
CLSSLGAATSALDGMRRGKPKSAQSLSLGFPILKLPPELQHVIFTLSDGQAVRNLRLSCKALAEIGLSHFMRDAELLFTRSSFDRLKDISLNYGIQVRSLHYCVDLLSEYPDISEYFAHVVYTMPVRACDDTPELLQDVSSREWWLRMRHLGRVGNPVRYTKRQLEVGWKLYSKLWTEQSLLRDGSYGENEITDIITRLPNLKLVVLSNFTYGEEETQYFSDNYKGTLVQVEGDEGYGQPCGLPQLFSLIQALYEAGTEIESFTAGLVSWRILEVGPADRKAMMSVFATLKSFKLMLLTTQIYERNHFIDRLSTRIEEENHCVDFISRGGHLRLLRSMPNLENLEFCVVTNYHFRLERMFRTISWRYLREIVLENVQGSGKDLLDFLGRHSATLRTLQIRSYWLYEGLWLYIFREMRANLALTNFEFEDGTNFTDFGDSWEDIGHATKCKIKEYVLRKEDVTLDDIIKHGESCSCQGGPYDDMHTSTVCTATNPTQST